MLFLRRTVFLSLLSLLVSGLQAQELTVKRMEVAPMDLSASTQPRNDLNGNPCGLVKVLFPTVGVTFEGNVLGDVAFKAGEYWVYMSEGSYMLNVKHPNFYPLMVNFRDYDIKKVEGKVTYVLTIGMPQTNAVEKKQKLTVNYSPTSAIVMIDSKPYQGNGHLELELPVGSHDYQIIAMGYVTAEGSLKLNEDAPKTITEHLVASSGEKVNTESVAQQQSEPKTQPQSVPDRETFTVNGVSFTMVRVEGGTFMMGSNERKADSKEKPVHQVTLSTYYIGETEVTQALWEAVMGTTVSQQGYKENPSWPMYGEGPNYPMYYISWDECQTFVQKLSQLTGKQFRLPTEAEWEYAARGGQKSRGYKYAGSKKLDDVAWHCDNSGVHTHPVAMKQANELGLYDMSGNVWEWCQDWFDLYSNRAETNPKGPSRGTYRVTRGGGWLYIQWMDCRLSNRGGFFPSNRHSDLGLRLAL